MIVIAAFGCWIKRGALGVKPFATIVQARNQLTFHESPIDSVDYICSLDLKVPLITKCWCIGFKSASACKLT